HRPPPDPPRTTTDELLRAYQTLGVSPTATDEEVQQAWRRLRVELHPDAAAGDPVEFERRSRLSAELNRARDIIFAHRRRTAGRRSA
ncbi:MAG TPA: J domain-containing protein, partial [Kofleriaceae bacterium]